MDIDLVERFKRIYANLPLGLRSEIVAVLDNEIMTWNVVKIEVDNNTAMGKRLLEYLEELEII